MKHRRLAICRHAQTAASRDKSLYDLLDPDSLPLTSAGVLHARAIGAMLTTNQFGNPLMVSSPSKRCLQTASILSSQLPCSSRSTVIVDGLRAQSWGSMAFAGRRELMKSWSYPDGLLNSCFPGGEPGWQVMTRALVSLSHILALPHTEDAVVVTHGIVLRCMLAGLLGWTPVQLDQSNPIGPGGGAIISLGMNPDKRDSAGAYGTKSSPIGEVPLADIVAVEYFGAVEVKE